MIILRQKMGYVELTQNGYYVGRIHATEVRPGKAPVYDLYDSDGLLVASLWKEAFSLEKTEDDMPDDIEVYHNEKAEGMP